MSEAFPYLITYVVGGASALLVAVLAISWYQDHVKK